MKRIPTPLSSLNRLSILAACVSLLFASCEKAPTDDTPKIPEGDYVNRTAEFEKIEGWKFRVSLYAEKQAVEKAGGQEAFLRKMDELMKEASSYFCRSGINDEGGNKLTFYITSFSQFAGSSKPYMTDSKVESDSKCDLRLVVNPGASKADVARGWQPAPYLSAGIASTDLFSQEALLELVKVLAEARGVYDYSLSEVTANDVNGSTYTPELGKFSSNNVNAGWAEYSKAVINAAGNSRIAKRHYEYIPSGFKAQVYNHDGTMAKEARLSFYKVSPETGKVATTPAFDGTLSITGNFIFASNPFYNGEDREDTVPNYLVEVLAGDRLYYTWMPTHQVELTAIQDPSLKAYKIQLPDFSDYIPDGDYVNRATEFAALPGWKFRVRVYGERSTVESLGGRIPFMKKVDKLMKDCSERYCYPGINDEGGNQVHFYMTDFRVFDGLSKTLRYDASLNDDSIDLTIYMRISTSSDDVGGGYLGNPYYNIGHNWDGSGGLWSGYGVDALVHEMGHYRGIPDLYAEKVDASKNPINGAAYNSIHDMMNDTYGNTVWTEYSRMIINANAGYGHVIKDHYEFLPKTTRMTIRKKDGTVATGAKVDMFPVKPYSYSVISTATYSFTLDSDYYTFPKNPFNYVDTQVSSDTYYTYLVRVVYNGKTTYVWWPIHEAELYGGTKGQNYDYKVTLSE